MVTLSGSRTHGLERPDNTPAYNAAKRNPFLFFASGRATVPGGLAGAIFAVDVVPVFSAAIALPELRLDDLSNWVLTTS